MDEKTILSQIDALVAEEHRLRTAVQAGTISGDDERNRLRDLEEALDQCWDLLRRRRAAPSAGVDPDAVRAAPREQVERYLQ
jgi:Protein of unknown function (DUF2630)